MEVARLAKAQGGPISRDQLLRMGLTRHWIAHALRTGRLHARYRGVYAVGHELLGLKGRMFAAVLACGEGAVLSHLSAARWWGISRQEPGRAHVTAPGRSRAGQRGIVLHRARMLDPRDVTEHEGVPIATVARTLLDCADVVPSDRLKRLIEEADRLRLFDGRAVHDLLERSNGRRGLRPLRLLLSHFTYDPTTRSVLEATFFDLCVEHDIELPTMNALVHGYEVDAYWPRHTLIVELDGYEFHKTQAAFERDRLRDAELIAAGYRVMRITWRQIRDDPAGVALRISQALGA